MKLLKSVVAVTVVGFIIFNIVNRDDIVRYFRMRQM